MDAQTKERLTEIFDKINKEYKDNYRIVHVDSTYWKNYLTKRKGKVDDLYFIGRKNSSSRPICITHVDIDYENSIVLHEYINHVNLSENSNYNIYLELEDGTKITCYGHEFCNPITQHHIYSNPDIDKILKGQLMGQNNDSPYQTVRSVINDGYDYGVRTATGGFLKNTSPVIQLITGLSNELMNSKQHIIDSLNKSKLPQNDNECLVKLRQNSYYTLAKVSELATLESNCDLSFYYSVIKYEDIKNILNELPKTDVDMTVIGLGSAGTGVLDQVSRSTYFNQYLLIDFDKIEFKNLRNQWYTRHHYKEDKVTISKNILCSFNVNDVSVHAVKDRFENAPLKYYKSKYVVSGFDTLECRLNLLDTIISGTFECEYLIDLRYLDYECSVYFIDLKDEKQVKYYRNLLEADIEMFNEINKDKYVQTKEQLRDFWMSNGYHVGNCALARHNFFKDETCIYQQILNKLGCGQCNDACLDGLWAQFQIAQPKIPLTEELESSCVRQNFIDIYKYASSFVFAAIREIEGDNPKPFTHIEAKTDVIPSSVVVRK